MKLAHPITVNGAELREVTLRRPKVRDRLIVDKMGASDADKEIALIANLAKLSREAVEELDLADFVEWIQALQGIYEEDHNRQ